MKSLTIFLFAVLLISATTLSAQNLQTVTYLEQTHMNPKLGTSIGYEFSDNIEIGGFFQRAATQQEAEPGRPLRTENEFYGAYFAYPVFSKKLADLKFNIRTGISNGENFVITPSLIANFKPLKNISIGGGLGTRSFRPTYMASIKINLNGGNNGGGLLALNH